MSRPVPYTDVIIDPESDLQVHHWAKDMQIEPYELRAAEVGRPAPYRFTTLLREVCAGHFTGKSPCENVGVLADYFGSIPHAELLKCQSAFKSGSDAFLVQLRLFCAD